MKLKTLKDMRIFNKEIICSKDFVGIALQSRKEKGRKKGLPVKVDVTPEFVHLGLLKQEAIKWIKDISEDYSKLWNKEESEVLSDMLKLKTDYCIEWIKHFFNITKKDLK